MYRNFKEIENQAKKMGPLRAVTLFPDDPDVMRTMADGKKLGLIEPILVGARSRIEKVANEVSMPLAGVEILDLDNPQRAADLCIETVVNGKASFIIKGNILTTYLYRALIRTTAELAPDQTPCTLCFHQVKGIDKIFVITDPGINILPNAETKRKILTNGINVLHHMGCSKPRVMILAAQRIDGLNSIAIKDAITIRETCSSGPRADFKICTANNLYPTFPDHGTGRDTFPDLFLVPNLETGNILAKSIDHLGGGIRQCVTVGGNITVLTPSRSDGYAARMMNLALGVVLSSSSLRRDHGSSGF
ncbi:MAG: hypothetical protein ABIJ52_09945 [Pseudomonadota bacterium]|nr:hypothetical protein [Pseudomonadota bacterium]